MSRNTLRIKVLQTRRPTRALHTPAPHGGEDVPIACLTFKDGNYWLRRRIPKDLRAVLGGVERWHNYRTASFAEAKSLHIKQMARVEVEFAQARQAGRAAGKADASEAGEPRTLGRARREDIRHAARGLQR